VPAEGSVSVCGSEPGFGGVGFGFAFAFAFATVAIVGVVRTLVVAGFGGAGADPPQPLLARHDSATASGSAFSAPPPARAGTRSGSPPPRRP